MATNEVVPGPTGKHVFENVKRLRAEKRLSLAQLAELLAEAGRPIRTTGLHRLENGKRRVDVDDLVGLAEVFGVSPMALLSPHAAQSDLTRITDDSVASWEALREALSGWSVTLTPLPDPGRAGAAIPSPGEESGSH